MTRRLIARDNREKKMSGARLNGARGVPEAEIEAPRPRRMAGVSGSYSLNPDFDIRGVSELEMGEQAEMDFGWCIPGFFYTLQSGATLKGIRPCRRGRFPTESRLR